MAEKDGQEIAHAFEARCPGNGRKVCRQLVANTWEHVLGESRKRSRADTGVLVKRVNKGWIEDPW